MDVKTEIQKVLKAHNATVPKQGDCCQELANELARNRAALVEALCANCCACHAAGCCPNE